MEIKLKDETVQLDNVHPKILAAICCAMTVWSKHRVSVLVITSANDGAHMSESKHYSGEAIDLRSRTLRDVFAVAADLRSELGPDFDVCIEKDHIHIEYDPKS